MPSRVSKSTFLVLLLLLALAAYEQDANSCSYGSPLFCQCFVLTHVHVPQLL